jgi:AcrR family transcriptional regulator
MTMTLPSTERQRPRRRRLPGEAREEALSAARRLLLERGPDAVTLKAVAKELGMTHTNLLHHFGSARELQSALMLTMVSDLGAAFREAVQELRQGAAAPEQIQSLVDKVFDAFNEGGAGRLAAWLALTGKVERLEVAEDALNGLVVEIERRFTEEGHQSHRPVTSAVLLLSLLGIADALVGETMTEMLHRERGAVRKLVAALLPNLF